MAFTWIRSFAGLCCLSLPLAALAQSDSNAPTVPSPGAQTGSPSSTSGQQTPGVAKRTTVARDNSIGTPDVSGGGNGESVIQMMKDKTFLQDAAQGGMVEVQAGQMASDKATNDKVKAFGQRMVTDHTMLDNELKPFADKLGVRPESKIKPGDRAELDKLGKLSGDDFDREYVTLMMKDHAADQKEFNSEAAMTGDADLKVAVEKGQRVIARHKRMIDALGASMGLPRHELIGRTEQTAKPRVSLNALARAGASPARRRLPGRRLEAG